MRRLAFTLRALRHKNFRLFFFGQSISLIGTWMTSTANSWLVYRITGSAFLLGVVGFANQFPAFLMAPVAGVYVDRWNKHRLLKICQTLSMIQSFALALFTLFGYINYSTIIALTLVQGFVNAFEIPCRQSFVVSMIDDKQDLGNAIALHSTMFNAARLIGPSLAGLIIAALNEGWCYFIDGVSYIAVIVSLFLMRVPRGAVEGNSKLGPLTQLREGWLYAYRSKQIRSIVILLALISLLGIPYNVLVPMIAAKVLSGGPHTLGFLMGSSGCGAMLGALWLASRTDSCGLFKMIPRAAMLFGMGLIGLSVSRWTWLSMLCMVVTGVGFMVQIGSSNTYLQTIVDDDKRGRIMSLFVMALLGTAPIGALVAGTLGDRMGPLRTIFLGGVACLSGALWFKMQNPKQPELRING